jgi:hypothetical protein
MELRILAISLSLRYSAYSISPESFSYVAIENKTASGSLFLK